MTGRGRESRLPAGAMGAALAISMLAAAAAATAADREAAIVSPAHASFAEELAAREVRRYFYLRTGKLLPIARSPKDVPEGAGRIAVLKKDGALLADLAPGTKVESALPGLGEEDYLLETVERGGRTDLFVIGGGPAGTLYGAYRLAEALGIRFALHGDSVPDGKVPLEIPRLSERGKPLFELRGIQPFHDFPEGPDWWNLDDYEAVLSQLPKLRMNFFGLHTYPEGAPNAEPGVWIGLPGEVGEHGRVSASYPSSWQSTRRGNWGYAPKKTSAYGRGADLLFERDDFAADVMTGRCPAPATPEASNDLFGDAGDLLRGAFLHARRLGIKTCIGTETPLTVPKMVKDRLAAAGKDPKDPAVLAELYAGIFERISRAYPLDYYWLWTPEGWTWSGTTDDQVKGTISDIQTAFDALAKVKAPFRLATCGWVLGPPTDRALFDNVLPKEIAVSCINRQVGHEAVDPGFERVKGRGKWAIPWLEDDPALTSPQLWAGRMREDAVLARAYGCTGLMGIHWRTRVLAPNVLALAQASWDQGWAGTDPRPAKPAPPEGPEGGQPASFPGKRIAGTEDPTLYQTVRYDVSAYRFQVPDGRYAVTLKFCEPHHAEAGKRVFGVKLQGKQVIDRLDIFEKVGKDKALDFIFDGVEVTGGTLSIDFVKIVEFPSIAAISIAGNGVTRKVNCGGPAYEDFAADPTASKPMPRGLPAGDFYRDWARAEFGPGAAEEAAEIFSRIDGKLPRPSDWVDGPGGLKPDPRKWAEVEVEYRFADEFGNLRKRIDTESRPDGAASRERLRWWSETFQYMKAVARVDCRWAESNQAMEKVNAEKDPEAKKGLARALALPARLALVDAVEEVYDHLLATVSNPGELGTVANWEQHILPGLLEKPAAELEKALGGPLPPEASMRKEYLGPPRVIVPTLRSSVLAGEELTLKVIVLAARPPSEAAIFIREMGGGEFKEIALRPVARGVFAVKLPPPSAESLGLEYHIRVRTSDGEVFFPAGAPERSQTLVTSPAEGER